MAEDKEIILFEVNFDAKQAEENATSFRKELIELRGQKADLDKQFKAGAIDTATYAKALNQLDAATKNASDGLKEQNKAIRDNATAQKLAQGSIAQMRQTVSELTKGYVELSKASRDSAQGKELRDKIKSETDELKKQEEALGNHTRSVGDYVKGIRIAGVSVGETQDAIKEGGQAFQVFTKGIGTTRGALIALTAVPILLLLTGLVAFLKSTDEGADKLAQGVAFLTEGFDSLMKGLAPIGKLLVDVFTSPLETLKSLIAGTDEYKVSLDQVVANAVRAGKANADYTKSMQDIEDAENALIVQRAKVGLQVDLALLKVKDRSLSEKQRLGILAAAGKSELDLARLTVKNATDSFNAIKKLNEERARGAKLTDDQVKAQDEAEAKVIDAQRASLTTQQAIQNRTSALIEQEAAARKAAQDKATASAKKAAQDRIAIAEIELIEKKRKGLDTLATDEKIINLTAKAAKIGGDVSASQRKLIEVKANADILALRVKHATELSQLDFENQENRTAAQLALVRKGSEQENALQQELLLERLNKEKSAAVDAANENASLRAGLQKKLRLLDANYNRDSEAIDKAFKQGQLDRDNDLALKRLETTRDLGSQTFAETIAYQAKLIDLEEKHSLEILALEDATEEERLIKLNAIQAKAIAARKALNEQELSQTRRDAIAIAEARVSEAAKGSTKEFKARKDLLKKQYDDELAAAKENEAEKAKIKAKYRKADADLEEEHTKQIIGFVTDSLTQSTSILSTLSNAQQERDSKRLQQQQDAALKSAGLSADAKAAIEEDFAKKKEKLDRQGAERARKLATFQNLINTANAITSALATGFDPFTKAIGVALAIATGIAQQAAIASADSFAVGGVVKGPSHKQGGIQMFHKSGAHMGEMEGDEIILTKNVSRDPVLRNMASAINEYAGGKSFATGTGYVPTPTFSLGGLAAMQGASGGSTIDYAQMQNMIVSAVAALPPQIVLVKDINTEQGRVARVASGGDIGY